ncbi:siderophore-interacting protein [Nocardioides sp. MH1]|uniref:siderophore-interacting protein n=1 Tax=Nocardioides sp. MH1 TaxID=3242490 RepID=UPI0035222F58
MTTPERPAKPAKPTTELTVTSTERLGPAMLRLRFAGDLAAFEGVDDTDRYVKLLFTPDGSPDLSTMADGERSSVRSYTVLELDVAAGTLAIDFALHGSGFAMRWARDVQPGATITVQGPGSGYSPDPTADWHLLVGDDAALPAVRQALAVLPPDAQGYAVLLVGSRAEELPLPAPAGVEVRWSHRDGGAGLADAVRELPWREGRVDVFVHGEAQAVMQEIRPYLRERGVDPRGASISGYWKRGLVDEEFRKWKRELAAAEAS